MDRFKVEIWYEGAGGESCFTEKLMLVKKGVTRHSVVQALAYSGVELDDEEAGRGQKRFIPHHRITFLRYVGDDE